jgi:VanZ family protein
LIPLRRVPFACAVLLSLVVLFSPASRVPSGIELNDKVVHATLFFVLAFTGIVAGLPLRALALGLALYAGVSEVLQAVLPIDRDGSVYDALADVIGVAAGLAAATLVVRRQKV